MASIPQLFVERVARTPDVVGVHWLEGPTWRAQTWRAAAARVAATTEALAALGVGPGDRVAILGNVHPRWLDVDLATLALGAITVGVYPTLLPDGVAHILRHSGARVLLAESEAELARVREAVAAVPTLTHARTWDLVPDDARGDVAAFAARAARVPGDAIATLIYTSGTTGDPKGAVLTHGAFEAVCRANQKAMPLHPGDRSIVYLPLAHSLQRMAVYRGLLDDVEAWWCPAFDRLPEVIPVARPHVLAAVPRVLEKMKARIEAGVAERGPRAQAAFARALAAGRARLAYLERGEPVPLGIRLAAGLADRVVFRKVLDRLGGSLRVLAVGGAALDPEVGRFFGAMGVSVLEGWGLTETCAPATANRPVRFRFGTVGPPMEGVELRLEDDGEVLVRGPGLFSGYWNDEAATRAALTPDGWFRTGDLGQLEDGFLRIVDRKKEIIVTAGGKNVAPVPIEKALEGGGVGQAVVIGSERPFLVALLAVDPDLPVADPEGLAAARVAAVNATRPSFEQVKRWAWIPPLSVEEGTLTPTLKLKRRVIAERHRETIEALYAGHGR